MLVLIVKQQKKKKRENNMDEIPNWTYTYNGN